MSTGRECAGKDGLCKKPIRRGYFCSKCYEVQGDKDIADERRRLKMLHKIPEPFQAQKLYEAMSKEVL